MNTVEAKLQPPASKIGHTHARKTNSSQRGATITFRIIGKGSERHCCARSSAQRGFCTKRKIGPAKKVAASISGSTIARTKENSDVIGKPSHVRNGGPAMAGSLNTNIPNGATNVTTLMLNRRFLMTSGSSRLCELAPFQTYILATKTNAYAALTHTLVSGPIDKYITGALESLK